MSLHRHKKHLRLGPAEYILILALAGLAAFMVSGSLTVPGADWEQVEGKVLTMRRVQNASSALGTPYRINVTYQFTVEGKTFTSVWEGEWPSSHSPNALPESDWDRLLQPGFPLVVLYDPEYPDRNSIHATQNHYPVWWMRFSLIISVLVLWCAFSIYPRWKTGH